VSQSVRVSSIRFAAWADTVLWQVLAYARTLQGRAPWTGRQLRRLVLVLWWTATFQLHTHARYWLRARRRRRITPLIVPDTVSYAIDPTTLIIPLSDSPLVSIIIPAYGQTAFTLRCLASLAAHAPSLPIEVIVIDDAWNGADAATLRQIAGIRLIHNTINLGFLRSCNKAAEAANGRYLLFLNNDTQVLANWLEPMVELFRLYPDTGAVGAKLLYPDGRLQEAGGIIWQDASGWNFGRLDDPTKPVYNYVREVDYCSGAALMVERAVFGCLGGFDPVYTPAYFEDTDLCFRLRRIGLKTLYQPRAQVIHHEGVSHGCDTAVGIKSYQVINRSSFINRWAEQLVQEHYRNGANVLRARDRAMNRKVVVVVDHYVPTPDRDAGSRTMMAFLEVLTEAGFVVKFWPHNLSYSPGYTEALQAMRIEVLHGPEQAPFEAWIKADGGEFDAVLVSRPDVAEEVIPAIRRWSKARIVYYGHDLHFQRMQCQAELTGDKRLVQAGLRMRERERAIWRQVDLSLYPSDTEAQTAAALQPNAAIGTVMPYVFDQFATARCAPARPEIIFVAGFGHPPNEDAAVWFVRAILPLIRADSPGVCLSIIGSNPTERVQRLAGDGITVFANVSDADLAAAYDRARVAVVPLRYGAGVKLKTAEALRSGVPLVTTSVGAQGLPDLSGTVPVQDDAAGFAAAVVALLHDDLTWESQSRRQVAYARARFCRDALTASLLGALSPAPAPALPGAPSRGWMATEYA
jgi:GT2 family glycosyltransferase